MRQATYPRNCVVLFMLGSAPFFILCLLSPLVNISISTNFICISVVLLYSLLKARKLEHSVVKITITSKLAGKDAHSILANCLSSLGYNLQVQENSLSKFETWIQIPFIPGEILAQFEDDSVLLTGPRYYIKNVQKRFQRLST